MDFIFENLNDSISQSVLPSALKLANGEQRTAKLNAYRFSMATLRPIENYVLNWKQRTKINTEYSSWEEILFGGSQGSILQPLIVKLQNASKTFFQWFNDNQIKSNLYNCNFICSTSKKVNLIVENKGINNSTPGRLLGVKIDSKLF